MFISAVAVAVAAGAVFLLELVDWAVAVRERRMAMDQVWLFLIPAAAVVDREEATTTSLAKVEVVLLLFDMKHPQRTRH